MGAPALADITIQDWGFESDKPGNLPKGFVPGNANGEAGRWEVTTDAKAPSVPNVLGRVPTDKAGPLPQVIFIEGAEASNLDLTVRIKAASGGEGQGGGMVFRAQDDRNYYVVWIDQPGNLVRMDKVVNGERVPLQELKVNVEVGKWHLLRLSIRGPELEAFFDNRNFLSAREDSWQHASYKKGKVGLWARGAGATYFDNIRFILMDDGTGSGALGGSETTIIK
jgi:hypothetical protein